MQMVRPWRPGLALSKHLGNSCCVHLPRALQCLLMWPREPISQMLKLRPREMKTGPLIQQVFARGLGLQGGQHSAPPLGWSPSDSPKQVLL